MSVPVIADTHGRAEPVNRHRIGLRPSADLDGFRRAVRALVAEGIAPRDVVFDLAEAPDLFGDEAGVVAPPIGLPQSVGDLIALVVCHRDPQRYALLYQLVWRVRNGEREVLDIASDPLVHRLSLMQRTIRRDLHKMHAFVRFRKIAEGSKEQFVAWFEPEHFILEAAAPFFVERFAALSWSILTPLGSVHWHDGRLAFHPAARRSDAPDGDAFEEGWRGYYESTFNPARINPHAMRAEMPKKYWKNLPETASIPRLVQNASGRVARMIEQEAAMPARRTPERALAAMREQDPSSLEALNAVIAKAGPLVPGATRAVLGEGPADARIVFVGEQPGDQEDLQGRPFVGPAGQLLDRALSDVGVERRDVYLTNAVKHFKFEQRGKRRIHMKPSAGEVAHYRPWLFQELALVSPRIVVALGATAALALTGKAVAITRARGPARLQGYPGFITVHPSYLLRLPDEVSKRRAYDEFRTDLARVCDLAAELGAGEGASATG